MSRAWVPWWDTSLKGKAAELIALVPEADRPLLSEWMNDPATLTAVELSDVEERILPALRLAVEGNDVQVRYRWVDNETGEVDGPVY